MGKLKEIEDRLKAATPGKWKAASYLGGAYVVDLVQPNGDRIKPLVDVFADAKPNADLIANAPTDIAYLLDQVSLLTARVSDLEATLVTERKIRQKLEGVLQWYAKEAGKYRDHWECELLWDDDLGQRARQALDGIDVPSKSSGPETEHTNLEGDGDDNT